MALQAPAGSRSISQTLDSIRSEMSRRDQRGASGEHQGLTSRGHREPHASQGSSAMRSRTNGASNRTIAEGMNSRGDRPRDGASRLKRRDMIRLGVASIGAGMVSGFDVVAAGATGQGKIIPAHKPLRAAFSNIGL